MRLESGPASAERNWQLVRVIIFLGFAAWFVYDGAVRYPHKNRVAAEQKLQAEPFKGQIRFDELGEGPGEDDLERLQTTLRTREQVHELLGQPTFPKPGETRGEIEYFVGRYGFIAVPLPGGRTSAANPPYWQEWDKTRAEIRGQFYWALVPLLPGLWFLWKLYKAVTLRVVIDDEGMVYDGRRIGWGQMTALRDYNPKGWIDLYYREDDAERRLRLDNEKVRRFDEIVAEISREKGFRNEVAEYAAARAREEAESAAAEAAEDSQQAETPPADVDESPPRT